MKPALSLIICCFAFVADIQFAAAQELQPGKQADCSDAEVLIIKKPLPQDKKETVTQNLRPLPAPRPEWFNGWEFFGLTKEGLLEKVAAINKLNGSKIWLDSNESKTAVSVGNFRDGFSYSFEYTEGKIARVKRESHNYNVFKNDIVTKEGEWMDERSKALSICIEEYSSVLKARERQLEKHLSGEELKDEPPSYLRTRAIICDYKELRDLHIKIASLLKEVGKSPNADEHAARDCDDKFLNSDASLPKMLKPEPGPYGFEFSGRIPDPPATGSLFPKGKAK